MWLTATILDHTGPDGSTRHPLLCIPIYAICSHPSQVQRRTLTLYGGVHSFHSVAVSIKNWSESWFHTSEGTRVLGSWFSTCNSQVRLLQIMAVSGLALQ